MNKLSLYSTILATLILTSCKNNAENEKVEEKSEVPQTDQTNQVRKVETEPLVTKDFTADPSAHVFNDKIYIYPSHDFDSGVPEDDLGNHFNMKDYHVYSMDSAGGEVTDHGVVLDVDEVKWAARQMWAPDAAEKDGKYYLYFPAKDKDDIFRIGVAVADKPEGPFKPMPDYIKGSFSIDPAVFEDTDGEYYMYFGGIWGGQLQRWETGSFVDKDEYPADSVKAIEPRIAKLDKNMTSFSEEPKRIRILDEEGNDLLTGDNDRRFFEAAWVHKMDGTYYLSYSTGDTHKIVYATSDNPYGPFTYQGVILEPVLGWTNHHSIVKFNGKWYLFFHDSSLSKGKTYLRSIKMTELTFNEDGSIQTINAAVQDSIN